MLIRQIPTCFRADLLIRRSASQQASKFKKLPELQLKGQVLQFDDYTNVTPHILNHLGRNLYLQKNHPLSHVRQRIVDFFYKKFIGRTGNPLFSVYDSLSPIVTTEQNFDSLLVPKGHPSYR